MTALLSARSLSRIYRDGVSQRAALVDVSFELAPGSFVAIVGPSGSGKTTLLAILGLLDGAFSGSLELQGREVSRLSDKERARLRGGSIGFVFQSFHLLKHLTALENVLAPGLFGPERPKLRERAHQALMQVGLDDRAEEQVSRLSGGQQQRVALARAVVTRPALLLCDEPTGNLDAESGAQVLDLLEEQRRQGVTVVVVTHAPELATRANLILRLVDGRLVSMETRASS